LSNDHERQKKHRNDFHDNTPAELPATLVGLEIKAALAFHLPQSPSV